MLLFGSSSASARSDAKLVEQDVTPVNFAPDADFEREPASDYSTNGGCAFNWSAGDAHSASHALQILATTFSFCRWLSRTNAIGISPGTTYTATAWLKISDVTEDAE